MFKNLIIFNVSYLCFLNVIWCFPQEIQSLLTNWKGPDLISYGELVLEGTFRLQRAKNERTLFLFDKLLLITKKREEAYTYKAHILVSHASHSMTCPKETLNIQMFLHSENTCKLTSNVSSAVLQPHAGRSYS